MAGQRFRSEHRVIYAECTLGNHVYHARYLDILETARGEFFRALGQPLLTWQERAVIFPIVECRLQYRHPARYDDRLGIELWVAAMTRIRLELAYRVINQAGQLILEASTHHVCTNLVEKPRRLPPELADALRPYCPPEERTA